jgi:ribonuclease P protein component
VAVSSSSAAVPKAARASRPDGIQTVAPAQSPPYRFPARLKLRRAEDFETVFRDGRRSADALFTVLYRSSTLDHARLGMTASAKKLRTAVGRNRVRRLVRESFRHAAAGLAGLDIVVLVKEPAARAGNGDIFASLDGHWARLQRSAPAAQRN